VKKVQNLRKTTPPRYQKAGYGPEQHGHGGWHASRVPLVNCLSPVESGLSIERGVIPGRRIQLGPGGQPTDKSMCLRSAMCAGTSLSSRAMCPKTEMRRVARISPNGVRPVCACTSTLLAKSDRRIPSICTSTFYVEGLYTLSCLLLEESKFLLRISVQTKPQLCAESETLILPNSMKRGHNRRSQSDTAFEILATESTGRLQTSEIKLII